MHLKIKTTGNEDKDKISSFTNCKHNKMGVSMCPE